MLVHQGICGCIYDKHEFYNTADSALFDVVLAEFPVHAFLGQQLGVRS